MATPTRRPGREVGADRTRTRRVVGWGLGAVLLALLLVGVALGILREPQQLDPATPEGAVQGYLQAVLDRDWNGALAHTTDQVQATCEPSDLRRAWVPDSVTATMVDSRAEDDTAAVTVRLWTAAEPEPFGGRYDATETFDVVRDDGTWRVAGQPWPLYDCRGW